MVRGLEQTCPQRTYTDANRHMKRCSALLVARGVKIKATVRHPHPPTGTASTLHARTRAHTCMHTCMHMHAHNTHVPTCTRTHTCMYICTHVCTHVSTHAPRHTHTCTHTRARTHAHTHARTHMQKTASLGEDVEKRNPCTSLVRTEHPPCKHLVVRQKGKHGITTWPTNSTPR